jgi:hypothetical protein
MPNSERTLRRLRRLGIIVAVLGVFTVASAVYFQIRQDRTDACVESKVDGLKDTLAARVKASEDDAASNRQESRARSAESRATRRVLLSLNDALRDDEVDPQAVAELKRRLAAYDIVADEVRAKLVAVRAQRQQVRQDRLDNPVPDFPAGSCEEDR